MVVQCSFNILTSWCVIYRCDLLYTQTNSSNNSDSEGAVSGSKKSKLQRRYVLCTGTRVYCRHASGRQIAIRSTITVIYIYITQAYVYCVLIHTAVRHRVHYISIINRMRFILYYIYKNIFFFLPYRVYYRLSWAFPCTHTQNV